MSVKSREGSIDYADTKEKDLTSSASEAEAEAVQAQQPLSVKDDQIVEEKAADEEGRRAGKLPFSKARCIALVLTVTTAAFLNVRLYCFLSTILTVLRGNHFCSIGTLIKSRPLVSKPRLSSSQPLAARLIFQIQGSSGLSARII